MPPAHDPTLAADLYERFSDALEARLARRYRGVDPQLVADAVVEAVLAAAAPGGDTSELAVARHARDRLRLFLRSHSRRKKREEKSVTTDLAAAPSPLDVLAVRELAARWRDAIATTDAERRALDAWLTGVTDPAELGATLGTEREDAARVLARFRQRIKRERDRHQEENPA
jgi:hypothetical protein